MIQEFQLYLYSVNPALNWSINNILLHLGSAAPGWKPLGHFWPGTLPSTTASDAHVEPLGCSLPRPSVRVASCPLTGGCASFTRAETPRRGGLKCAASTLSHCHLALTPPPHQLREGKSSHTRRGQRSIQSPLPLLTQVINTCPKTKQEHQGLNNYKTTCSSKAWEGFSWEQAYGLVCRECYKPQSEPSQLKMEMPQHCLTCKAN